MWTLYSAAASATCSDRGPPPRSPRPVPPTTPASLRCWRCGPSTTSTTNGSTKRNETHAEAVDLMAGSDIPFSAPRGPSCASRSMTSGRADEDRRGGRVRRSGPVDRRRLHARRALLASSRPSGMCSANQERCLPSPRKRSTARATDREPDTDRAVGHVPRRRARNHRSTRARSVLETAIEHGRTVGSGSHVTAALAFLARMGTDATSPKWATRIPQRPRPRLRSGRHRLRPDVPRHLRAGARQYRPCRELRRSFPRSSSVRCASYVEPDLESPTDTTPRSDSSPGSARNASPSSPHTGATLGYDEAVALAFAELDRVIANKRVLADAAEHDSADLPLALGRLQQTNFRASERLIQWLLEQDAKRRAI